MENEKYPQKQKEYFPRIYLPRSSLKPIEVSLTLNINPNYHILDEIERFEKDKIKRVSLENKLSN